MRTILFILITVFSLNISAQTKEQKKFNKEFGKVLKENEDLIGELVLIEGGQLGFHKPDLSCAPIEECDLRQDLRNRRYIYRHSKYKHLDKDSTLLLYESFNSDSVAPFLVSSTEITNDQYRQFINWVRDSIARSLLSIHDSTYLHSNGNLNWDVEIEWNKDDHIEILADLFLQDNERFLNRKQINSKRINYNYDLTGKGKRVLNIYPDSSCWVTEFPWSFNEPMKQMYFWHPVYDDYPIVGISFDQAQAYCHWLTMMINKKKPLNKVKVYLPNELQWKVAAGGFEYRKYFDLLESMEGGYVANFGPETSQNNYSLKEYTDDGGLHTIVVQHYPPNEIGLYEVMGNVSEWTTTKIDMEEYLNSEKKIVRSIDSLRTAADSLRKYYTEEKVLSSTHESTYSLSKLEDYVEILQNELIQIRSDIEIIKKCKDCRVVKGGSWAQSAIYTDAFGAKEVKEATTKSSMTGFRICISVTPEIEEYYKSKKRKR